MIDQPFGSGRALLLGTNPFYRAWIDGEERLVGNGILFPLGAPIAPNASAALVAAAAEPASAPVAAAKLPASKSRPDTGGRNTSKDLMIKVKRSQGAALKSAAPWLRLTLIIGLVLRPPCAATSTPAGT